MAPIEKQLAIIDLYYENAILRDFNDFFLEASDESLSFGDKAKDFAKKVREFIQKVIDRIKEFFNQVIMRVTLKKELAQLKIQAAKLKHQVKFLIRDKMVTKYVGQALKAHNAGVKQVQKAYTEFMRHKIDYSEFMDKIDEADSMIDKKLNAIDDAYEHECRNTKKDPDDFHVSLKAAPKAVEEALKYMEKLENCLETVKNGAEEEQKKLDAIAASQVSTSEEASATSKVSSLLSALRRKVANLVTRIFGPTGVVSKLKAAINGAVDKAKAKKGSKDVTESAEEDDSSDDDFDALYESVLEDADLFDESAGDMLDELIGEDDNEYEYTEDVDELDYLLADI